jgi:hypothetical protein
MKKPSAIETLNQDIILLKAKRDDEFNMLKKQIHISYESIKPINLIKNAIKNVTELPDIKEGIGKVAIGVASGYLVKNIIFRSSYNPLKKLAGIALQVLVTNVAAKNSDKIKETGKGAFHLLKSLIAPKKKVFSDN